MKKWLAVLLAVFGVGMALFFLRNGPDTAVRVKPPTTSPAPVRAAPFGTVIQPAATAAPTATATPSPAG